jgi:lysine/ornithine N-monooxygenase
MDEYKLIIIGFGISGISLAKEASKNNIKYKVLEKNKSFGGVWFNSHNNTSLQSHRNFYEFSDEECMSESYGDYPKKNNILEYLNRIINKYNIDSNIEYNYEVKNTHYCTKSKYWIIDNKYKSKFIGVCSGINADPIIELKQNELKSFTGIVKHTSELRDINVDDFNNKNIIIIGNGASACDILKIFDEKKIKSNLTCIYRSPKYYINKYILGFPVSALLCKPIITGFKYMPINLYRLLMVLANLILFCNYLEIPKEKMNSTNLVACNIISKKIKNGSLVYLNDRIVSSEKNHVVLAKNILLNIDIIILATGYRTQEKTDKYLQIFDKDIENCGFIGFSPSYNWPKISEKQSKIFINYILGGFKIELNDVNTYIKKHSDNQSINKLKFNDLTYEMYNY